MNNVTPMTEKMPKRGTKSSTKNANQPMSIKDMLDDIRKTSSWNHSPERTRKLEELKIEYSTRVNGHAGSMEKMAAVIEEGKRARDIIYQLTKEYQKQGDSDAFKECVKVALDTEPSNSVKIIITSRLDKQKNFFNQKRINSENLNDLKKLESPVCDPYHPNTLNRLPVHHQWEVLIDESGDAFSYDDINTTHLNGRMVALALSKNKKKLPKLPPNFHANKESNQTLVNTLQTLLDNPVGILGVQINDPVMQTRPDWLSGIILLVKLVLRQLPLPNDQASSVKFFIEHRGDFNVEVSLKAVSQLILSELRSLNPARYEKLNLQLQFVPKDGHPSMGYVDLLAYIWKSSNTTLLRLSNLRGHCFLQRDQQSLMRCFAALEGGALLEPNDWYTVASALESEPQHSLLFDVMADLGKQVKSKPELWQRYLEYVEELLANKSFRQEQLGAAIDWLQQWQPATAKIPQRLKLQWLSAQLARDNHLGRIDRTLADDIWKIGKELVDEAAPEVCHAHLRVAVTAMNRFQFAEAERVLAFWQQQPIAVPGLLNHAKVLSSLGQLAAFKGNSQQAVELFDQALLAFSHLSSTAECAKESAQTRVYRLIALTDDQSVSDAQLETLILEQLPQVAQGKLEKLTKFQLHALLRAVAHRPDLLKNLNRLTLATVQHVDAASAHPWQLIALWQGWLAPQGNDSLSRERLKEAITICLAEPQGITMRWIGAVLLQFARHIGLEGVSYLSEEEIQQLRSALPNAAWADWERLGDPEQMGDAMKLLASCLPFNYR